MASAEGVESNSIPIVDIRVLSQSELYSLALSSPSSFDYSRRCDDVLIPKIDRSVFNESAGSRKQTYSRLRLAPAAGPRRRTPHLRRPTAFPNISDPENARIVILLKHLFVSPIGLVSAVDMDPAEAELVPLKVDYSHSSMLLSSPPSNVGPTGRKRKRGRPRKNEGLGKPEEVRAVDVDGNLVVGLPSSNVEDRDRDRDREVLRGEGTPVEVSVADEMVLGKNAEDIDREVLNRDGVAVDLVALGAVEHPFWEEIRNRTQGLETAEDLLGFLNGLNGQWGSRRKKKKIVDASEFGNALPVGWKLLLSVKKKNARVWLYCRRYISPSGRQFVSCKEVSSYLLSLHGIQVTSPHVSTQHNDAHNCTSVTIEDITNQDDSRRELLASGASSPPFTDASGNIIINAGDSPDRTGKTLHCNKCIMTFSETNELLQHQSSVHQKKRNKNASSITDGVIIKDGKYECQFCHKTFSERHRYNGHVGAHVRYQAKMAGASPAGGKGESIISISCTESVVQDTITKGSMEADNAAEICNAFIDKRQSSCSPYNEVNDLVGDAKEANGNIRGVDQATDGVSARSLVSVDGLFFSSNENKSLPEASDSAHMNVCATEVDSSSLQGRESGNILPLTFNGKACGTSESAVENSVPVEKPKQDAVCETSFLNSSNVEVCDINVNNENICQARKELKLGDENFAVNECKFEFFGSHNGEDKGTTASEKQLNNFEDIPCENIEKTDNTSTSASVLFKLNNVSNITMLASSHDEKSCAEDNVCLSGKYTTDETCNSGTCDKGISEADIGAVNGHMEMRSGISSVILSWNKQNAVPEKSITEMSTCILEEPRTHNTINRRLVALPDHESESGVKKNDFDACGRKMEIPEFEGIRNSGNGGLNVSCGLSHAALNFNSTAGTEQDRKIGAGIAFTSTTDKQFFTEDSMYRVFNSGLEEHNQEASESVLFRQSGVSQFSNAGFTVDDMYPISSIQPKLHTVENTSKNELSLSFANFQTGLHTDSNRLEQEKYPTQSSNIQSSVHKTAVEQTCLGVVNSNIPGDQKQGRGFGIDFLDSSFNNRTHEFGSSFKMLPEGGNWSGPRRDNVGNAGQNIMVGFGSSNSQSGDLVAANMSWITGQGDLYTGCFDAASNPQVQSSSYFHTFDLASDKGEKRLSGINENYDMNSDILSSNRIQPVEYSFMGEQSSNSVPEEPKIFPFNANMEPGLDPSFWLGKDALMQNTAQSNPAMSVCVWCRNEFYNNRVQPGIQTGEIGSLCPSCSTRIPGQFSMF